MRDPNWPKHEDGRLKKIGEMTQDEARGVFKASAQRIKAEIEHPAMQRLFGEIHRGTA